MQGGVTMTIASERIKELRKKNGMTQKELAEILNVSQNAVYNWENDKRAPNADVIKQIASFFGVSPAYLLGWQDQNIELFLEIRKLVDQMNETTGIEEAKDILKAIEKLASMQEGLEKKITNINSKNPQSSSVYFDINEYSESELIEIKNYAEFLKNKRTSSDKD